jgi:hypothetical protein
VHQIKDTNIKTKPEDPDGLQECSASYWGDDGDDEDYNTK